MTQRIHYFVHGRGRGHASRARSIVACLQNTGFEVRVFAGEDAAPALAGEFACEAVGSLPPSPTLQAARLLKRRVDDAVRRARADRIALVVSDGDLPALLAASRRGTPSVAVGHGLVFSDCVRPSPLSALPWWREAAKSRISAMTAKRRVAVNFVPLDVRRPGTVLARPEVALRREPGGDAIVCYFRDPAPDVVAALVRCGVSPLVFAAADPKIAGASFHPVEREAFVAALVRAKAVVATAGSQLIAECVALGVPLFALHRAADDEQRLNVEMLRWSGRGDGGCIERLDEPRLRRFVTRPPELAASPPIDLPGVAQAVTQQCQAALGVSS